MPRRRDSVCKRAVAAVIENLEKRTLLTTMVGGGVDAAGNPIGISYIYLDANDTPAMITVGGNTTIEAIFADVSGFSVALGGRVLPPPEDAVDPPPGRDLFHVYVAQADSSSFVTVTEFDPENGDLLPFAGGSGSFRVSSALNGRLIDVTPEGSGSLILGTRSINRDDTDVEEGVPISTVRYSGAFGARPDLGQSRIRAGFQVADGVNFGDFLFAGTVIGVVNVGASMGSFYCGDLWTGDATGRSLGTPPGRRSPNFLVRGDLQSLLVSGSIGTDDDSGQDRPDYVTGTEISVAGKIGQVHARGSILAGINAVNNPVRRPDGGVVGEVEGVTFAGSQGRNDPSGWSQGLLAGSDDIRNDTFNTAQLLPSFTGTKGRSNVTVDGLLGIDAADGQDFNDYYGIGLMAGQAISVQLTPEGGLLSAGLINVGIFDPDGRLVATDYANVNTLDLAGATIRYVADRPGIYRIAIAGSGDVTFDGPTTGETITLAGDLEYRLSINEAGNLGIGGIHTDVQFFDGQSAGAYGVFCQNGDLGGVEVDGLYISQTDLSLFVRKGNLRALEAGQIGINIQGRGSPMLSVRRGSVGLVNTTNGQMVLNALASLQPNPVGGDYQVVSSAGTFLGFLDANRRLGVIRAADMATLTPSRFAANVDEIGDDGIIDLIDVPGSFGTLGGGGPAISTGNNGNVRYMRVAYTPGSSIFRDEFFGGGGPEATQYSPGEVVNLTDDSGTRLEFEPLRNVNSSIFQGTNGMPSLNITAYGIRGSGGVAVINVTVDGSLRIGAGGGRGRASHAEIGTVTTTGQGNPVLRSTASGQLAFAFPTRPSGANTNVTAATLDLLFDGSGRLDVFEVRGSDFTSIINETSGEIVNIDATVNPIANPNGATNNGTIGALQATTIGTAQSYTGAALNPVSLLNGGNQVYPFNAQRVGVNSGNILNVQTAGALGNLLVNGSIGNVAVNSGGRNTTGKFEGINGPIYATDSIGDVNIGQGIAPSGSGNVSRAGLYAVNGSIGNVRNQGLGSDIRGDIISGSSIASIRLSNGAIIGSKIALFTDPAFARRFVNARLIPGSGQPLGNRVFDIGEISLGGSGGIIGSDFAANAMGPISVKRGFGIINSSFNTNGNGSYASVTAEGYGIRDSFFEGGSRLGSLNATSSGKNISVLNYSPSVRQSERTAIDPFFQQAPSPETDLHAYFGTSAATPRISGVTEPGMIDAVEAVGNRDLGRVFANTIRNSTFNFASTIGEIQTRSTVNGLTLTTGALKNYLGGANGVGLDFTVAGKITKFRQVGTLDQTSRIRAVGGSGSIVDFIIDGNLNGDVSSSNSLHLLAVGKDLGSTSLVQARSLDIRQVKGKIFGTIKITG